MTRRSFEVASMAHTNPIPAVTRVGPLVVSSVIVGRDPGSSNVPESIEAQLANLFHHVGEMLAAAGADWRHVAKMNGRSSTTRGSPSSPTPSRVPPATPRSATARLPSATSSPTCTTTDRV